MPLKGSTGSSLNQSCSAPGGDSRTSSAAGVERISLRCAESSAVEKQTAATTSQHRVARLICVVTISPGAIQLGRWAWRLRTPGRRTRRCVALRELRGEHGQGLRARLMSRSTSSRRLPRAAPHSFWLPQSGQRVTGSTRPCYNADGLPRPDERSSTSSARAQTRAARRSSRPIR